MQKKIYQLQAMIFLALLLNFFPTVSAKSIDNILYAAPVSSGAGDCSTWSDACTLTFAINSAVSGEQVWAKSGIHVPGSTVTDTFSLKNGVSVYGGFAGNETSLDQRQWQTNITILSGDIDDNDITDARGVVIDTDDIVGNNVYHVVNGSNTDNSAILDGFIITAGKAVGAGTDSFGGGIYIENGNPVLVNNQFIGNFAIFGGGMHNSNSSPQISNVSFSFNAADTDGGGIRNDNSNPDLVDVVFQSNSAKEYGGGIHNSISSPNLTNILLDDNTATNGGGMSNIENSSPHLVNVVFQNNFVDYSGGGIFNNNSNPKIDRASFIGNSAVFGGGGIYNTLSSPEITNSIISFNSADDGNSSTDEYGGGIRNYNSSSPVIKNSTIYANSAASGGGGIGNRIDSKPVIVNTIIWGNTSPNPTEAQIYNTEGSSVAITYSNVQGVVPPGIGNKNVNPLFVSASTGNLRLLSNSPLVDVGSITACLLVDRDNKPRPRDGNKDGSLGCDIGAYESFETFIDVPNSHWAWDHIERLAFAGITGGCGGGYYCPDDSVTRAQMAIFLERGINGSSYSPPPASGTVFGDIATSYWAAAWIERLFADGITGGCGNGNYCPETPVTRAQMAIFLLRSKHGSSYVPPDVGTSTGFNDVPVSYWAAAWIKQLAAEGITGGCGNSNYCPDQPVNRAQMAIFLVRVFNLP